MTNLHQILQAIVTVLAVINPVVCGSLFLTLTPNLNAPERRREALYGAHRIINGNAIRAGRPQGFF
jgi:small neutral amino acid transporter SnatA (MarC family)